MILSSLTLTPNTECGPPSSPPAPVRLLRFLVGFPSHRENDRATLVGERTFGKGVIQTVEPLTNGGGVAVTVAR